MKRGRTDPCCCSPCAELDTHERPLFATGQTLTAADLTALQDYVTAKNRLHNRYQHGWGVVCGLEVLCDDCDGSVNIRPGYALDPCGNDIVVAGSVRYDLVKAIRDCSRVEGKRTGDCDPWLPPRDEGCGEALSYWCIAVRYREVETAVGQRLTNGGKACQTLGSGGSSGGCGCGGSCGCEGNGSCGCGSCETPRTRAVADYRPTALAASNACAPRRVRECFDVTIIPRKEECAPKFPRPRDRGSTNDAGQPLGLIGWLLPERSLLRNILDCLTHDTRVLTDRLSERDTQILSLLLGPKDQLDRSDVELVEVHAALCRTRGAVLELLQDDFGTTRCQLLRATAEVTLPPPAVNADGVTENREGYLDRASRMAFDLLAAWLQAILDCICRAFLPRCPDVPCDDRVELACVTVKNGRILAICNHSCRRYAGAFPSMIYWMSIVPLVPLFARLLAMLCCQPDLLRRNSPVVNDLLPLLDQVDPSGSLRRRVVADDFALPRRYITMAAKFADTPVLRTIADGLQRLSEPGVRGRTGPAAEAGRPSAADEIRRELTTLQDEVRALKASLAHDGGINRGRSGSPGDDGSDPGSPPHQSGTTAKPRKS